jgi:hypothetical protein
MKQNTSLVFDNGILGISLFTINLLKKPTDKYIERTMANENIDSLKYNSAYCNTSFRNVINLSGKVGIFINESRRTGGECLGRILPK